MGVVIYAMANYKVGKDKEGGGGVSDWGGFKFT